MDSSVQQQLAATGSAVAMLILTYQDGSSWGCTGTLLNTTSYPSAIVITANHCVAGDSGTEIRHVASVWFFQRPSCGSTGLASYVQMVTVPTLLWHDENLDGALLNLDQLPPAGAKYAAWTPISLAQAQACWPSIIPSWTSRKEALRNIKVRIRVPC